jgi:stage IV sporulation protein B
LSADGVKLTDRTTLDTILKNSKGKKIKLEILRGQNKSFTEISPVKTKDGYKLGLYLRDSAAGLGTVTCVDPETNEFFALGHGINDFDTGKILTLKSGRLVTCIISGVQKGEKGRAGELKGTFGVNARQLGIIKGNTRFGLYGTVYKGFEQGEAILVGSKETVHVGKAEMYSDFEGTMKKYSIEIQHVNNQTQPEEKSMVIKITDQHLIDTTGGIVQGLSGSPIVQDGKLIGAVTHVMLSDATRGYGIFIENMLSAAEKPARSAA